MIEFEVLMVDEFLSGQHYLFTSWLLTEAVSDSFPSRTLDSRRPGPNSPEPGGNIYSEITKILLSNKHKGSFSNREKKTLLQGNICYDDLHKERIFKK